MRCNDDGHASKRQRCCEDVLPSALVAYARRLLTAEAAKAGRNDVDRLLTELEAASRGPDCGPADAKRLADGFRSRTVCVARALRNWRDVFQEPAAAASASVAEILGAEHAHRAQCEQARRVIGEHHQHLRADVATAPEDERGELWQAVVSDTRALQAYAQAAAHTGGRGFVRDAHRWGVHAAREFFHGGGAAAAAVKDARRRHFQQHGTRLAPAEEAAVRDAAQAAVAAALGGGRIRVLDIGSCHDPWRREQGNDFDVVALDLHPLGEHVFRCDFLALDVGTSMAFDPPQHPCDGAGTLHRLAAASFHVAVLSLVLSYVPDAMARARMVALARRLLHDTAGLLLIVTPISTDAGFTPRRQLPVLQEWRESIEQMGFARHAYERLRTVHVMAYRTVAPPQEAVALKPLRIAYDARVHAKDKEGGMPQAPAEREREPG